MKIIRIGAVMVAVGVTLALAGCSHSTTGSAAPVASSAGAPASSATAPALDPEPYRSKPCGLLPAGLPASLGYHQPPTSDTTSQTATLVAGPACSWLMPTEPKMIQVQVLIKNRDANLPGLAKTFLQLQRGLIAYADPTEVSGYEAAFADLTDERARGNCALVVAVSADEAVNARASGYSGAQESCDMAKQLAEAMIKTLQGGS